MYFSIFAYLEWAAGHKSGAAGRPEIRGLGARARVHSRHFFQNDRVRLGGERAKVLVRALKCHPAVLVFPRWEDHLQTAAYSGRIFCGVRARAGRFTRSKHVLVCDVGWYSKRVRARRAAAAAGAPVVQDPGVTQEIARRAKASWARLIEKDYEVEPLECPHSKGSTS